MPTPPLAWTDDLLLGHEEMDSQHRDLVRLAGELQAGLTAGEPAGRLAERYAALADHTRSHFTSEEGLMLASGYSGYAAHRAEHQRLLDQLDLLRLHLGDGTAAELLVSIIMAWTVPHIRSSDKQLAAFLQQTGFTLART